PSLQHWPWRDPRPDETVPALSADLPADLELPVEDPMTARSQPVRQPSRRRASAPDLVVLSHLRWSWVWQRPQHIVSRLAQQRAEQGAGTWIVEEPVTAQVDSPRVATQDVGGLTRVW